MNSRRVVIAPDSFKGSMSAEEASRAIAAGWLDARPFDDVRVFPMADGGEGTLAIVHNALPESRIVDVGPVTGPDGRPTPGHYLALGNDTALVELAVSSGITLMNPLNAMTSTSAGVGETIRVALDHGIRHVIIALGGSASTDAGIGALRALGLHVMGSTSVDIKNGGEGLANITSVDTKNLLIPERVTILRDTTATFLDAPAMFGPQKGATSDDVTQLTHSLQRLLELTGDTTHHLIPGAGAAGGCGWGFAHFLGGDIIDGARAIADLTGVTTALPTADAVVTGEGKFDQTSLTGKVTGAIISAARAQKIPVGVVAGVVEDDTDRTIAWSSLVEQAGGAEKAMASPTRFASVAARNLASRMFPPAS